LTFELASLFQRLSMRRARDWICVRACKVVSYGKQQLTIFLVRRQKFLSKSSLSESPYAFLQDADRITCSTSLEESVSLALVTAPCSTEMNSEQGLGNAVHSSSGPYTLQFGSAPLANQRWPGRSLKQYYSPIERIQE
jgi:hypothetical protein